MQGISPLIWRRLLIDDRLQGGAELGHESPYEADLGSDDLLVRLAC